LNIYKVFNFKANYSTHSNFQHVTLAPEMLVSEPEEEQFIAATASSEEECA